jgi:hypothetical protein
MRKTLLAAAAMLGTTLALPALAQSGPAPATGGGTDPQDFLKRAQQDVQHHRAAAAEAALEQAETRLLDRSTLASEADQPDSSPAVQAISQATAAIRKHDWQTAKQQIDTAMQQAQMAQSGNGMSGNGMTAPSSAMTPASAPAAAAPAAAAPATGTAPAQGGATGGMTSGEQTTPMGGVSQPNGGVMTPAGGVMPPSTQ